MSPSIVLMLIGGGAMLGILGYTYHQGKQSCVSFYEHQIAQNKIANQQKEIKNYKDAQEYNDQLVGEATTKAEQLRERNEELKLYVDQIQSTDHICVSYDFLRELGRLRSSTYEKKNTKPAK